VLQIVVEDYINHIAGKDRFKLERHFGENERWYRTNRITLEFNLLYRWHGLVPDVFAVDGQVYDHQAYRFNNALLEQHGVERCINAASTQPAGRVQLHNTPYFLEKAEIATLDMSRTFALQPFVKYCERFSERPPQSIKELVGGDERAAAALIDVYGDDVTRVELPIGLIAQARSKVQANAVLPPLVTTMVAVDAFTHILTNPILADQVYDASGRAGKAGRWRRRYCRPDGAQRSRHIEGGAKLHNSGAARNRLTRLAEIEMIPRPVFRQAQDDRTCPRFTS
jgi:prostaglandin-endoperoxide synthase 2